MKNQSDWDSIFIPALEIENIVDILLDKCSFIDILQQYNIDFYACNCGDFTHKVRCPFFIHKMGLEKTPSMYISETSGRFYCYGCNNGGSVVDFIMLYKGMPFAESIDFLFNLYNLNNNENNCINKKLTKVNYNIDNLYNIGIVLRDYLYSLIKYSDIYNEEKIWVDKNFKIIDKIIFNLDKQNIDQVNEYCLKLINSVKKRQNFYSAWNKW